jgi:hypothetical protein
VLKNKNVVVLEIYYGTDSDSACLQFDIQEGIKYPSISGAGGGGKIIEDYRNGGGMAFATVAMIAPDRKVVENFDAYNSYYDDLPQRLLNYDIGTIGINDKTLSKPNELKLTIPGVINNNLHLSISLKGLYGLNIFSANGRAVMTMNNLQLNKGRTHIPVGAFLSNGTYIIHLYSKDYKGINGKLKYSKCQ